MTSLLGADLAWSWGSLLEKLKGSDGTFTNAYGSWLNPLMSTLSTILWVVLALVGAAGGIYAVYVGIKMARADSAEQRDENKKRMINIIVAIIVVIVLIFFFNTFLPMILDATGVLGRKDQNGNYVDTKSVVTAAKVLLRLPL